jgi:outer membrane biosynthesis protein TonB
MLEKRYYISLSLTLFLYLSFGTIVLYSFSPSPTVSDKDIDAISVHLSISDFVPEMKEKKAQEDEEPEIETKVEQKELPKSTISKKIVEKKNIVQKKRQYPPKKLEVAKKFDKNIVGNSQKNIRLLELKERIASKKYYPEFAKKRGIEGRVTVYMKILPNGSLGGLRMNGPKIFHASIRQIVRDSFPLQISGCVADLPQEVSINLDYSLRN